jgi:hypothetical protein
VEGTGETTMLFEAVAAFYVVFIAVSVYAIRTAPLYDDSST